MLRRPRCSTRCARNGIPRRVAPPRLGPHRPPGGLSGGDECLDRVETQIARDRWGDIPATANVEFPDGRAVSLISNLRAWSVVRQRNDFLPAATAVDAFVPRGLGAMAQTCVRRRDPEFRLNLSCRCRRA